MLSALNDVDAEYIVVDAHALAAHGYPRATGDFDIWVRPTERNAERVWQAIERFGAPRRGVIQEDFHSPDVVFQIGVAPNRIDILTSITGVDFDRAWENRIIVTIDNSPTSILGRDDLITNKRATGRPKDLIDVIWLESIDKK